MSSEIFESNLRSNFIKNFILDTKLNSSISSYSYCSSTAEITSCNQIDVGSFGIHSPLLIPSCLAALVLGIIFSKRMYRTKTDSNIFYAVTFMAIGVMMTISMLNHCFFPLNLSEDNFFYSLAAFLDVDLTSTIAFLFLLDGLLDLRIINQNQRRTYKVFVVGFLSISLGWLITMSTGWELGFLVMYLGIVGVGCGSWCFIQVWIMIRKRDFKGLGYFLIAGFSGLVGLVSVADQGIDQFFCENFGCLFAQQFLWFLVTDIAMFCIYKYCQARVPPVNLQSSQSLLRVIYL
jgi:hypothetical protein